VNEGSRGQSASVAPVVHSRRAPTHLLISPAITLHTNSLHGEESSESLSDIVVEASSADLIDEDLVGVLSNLDLRGVDLAENADGESWAGEGVTADEVGGDVEETAEGADFVCGGVERVGQ